ncbi:hypothetical protein AMECASPLE_034706 [Ameca splendens]|uniref:C2H2-type domain-containing protein n=1 Tax=Ameca splendens TaxID=208324 RepID=A0ABV0XKE7_9TELE
MWKKISLQVKIKRTHANPHRRLTFACGPCGKSFASKSYLYKHMTNPHRREKTFGSDACGNYFAFKSSLNIQESKLERHFFDEIKDKPFAGYDCGKDLSII